MHFKSDHVPQNNMIPQFDGLEDESITEVSEVEIYERESTVLPPPASGAAFQSLSSRTASFALNRIKQVERLGVDANIADFEVTINDSERNVNIACSSGFYDKVAKPVICGLSEGSTVSINNISIQCTHIDFNRDSTLTE